MHITVSRGFLFSCEQIVRERARGKSKEAKGRVPANGPSKNSELIGPKKY